MIIYKLGIAHDFSMIFHEFTMTYHDFPQFSNMPQVISGGSSCFFLATPQPRCRFPSWMPRETAQGVCEHVASIAY